jgi:transcriptional regulator with XRE-family HTH domain
MQVISKNGTYFYFMSIGTKLKEFRKSHGLSQSELGIKLGTTQKVISDYETEKTSPPPQRLPSIAKYFGVSIDELLDSNNKPSSKKKGKTLHANKRTYKVMEMFDQLNEEEQRVITRQIKALIEGKKYNLL